MLSTRFAVLMTLGVIGLAAPVAAQEWPNGDIRYILHVEPGGATDVMARRLADGLQRELGVNVVVENRAGASGMIGTKALSRANPDGYTIGQVPISVTRFSQLGMLQLDPRTDLTYLARTSGQTFGIAVPSASRFRYSSEQKRKPRSRRVRFC